MKDETSSSIFNQVQLLLILSYLCFLPCWTLRLSVQSELGAVLLLVSELGRTQSLRARFLPLCE